MKDTSRSTQLYHQLQAAEHLIAALVHRAWGAVETGADRNAMIRFHGYQAQISMLEADKAVLYRQLSEAAAAERATYEPDGGYCKSDRGGVI